MHTKVDIMVSRVGPNGRPIATIFADEAASISAISATIEKNLTRNTDLLKRLGLKACQSCRSGFDLDIRQRFEEVMHVELENVSAR
jgi:hypothetical protein